MSSFLEVLARWINRAEVPPLVYAASTRTRSQNRPFPLIGLVYQAGQAVDWWEQGGVRLPLPPHHMRVGWTHHGASSSEPRGDESYWAVAFDVSGTTLFDPWTGGPPIVPIPIRDSARLNRAFQEVASQFLVHRRTSPLRLKAALLSWMAVLLDEAYGRLEAGGASVLPRPVEKAIDFMHRNIGRHDLTLPEVAQAAGLSLHYFGRTFLEAMGQPPIAYLRQVRIEHAKNMLRDMRVRISEAARESGFADPLHFSRVFHRSVGQSPRAFREQQASD